MVKMLVFVSILFLGSVYGSVESELSKIQHYVQKYKFPLYDFITYGDTYETFRHKFSKQNLKFRRSCSKKLPQLCFVSTKEVPKLKIIESEFVFFNNVLIRSVILIDGKGRNRIEVIKEILENKKSPDYVNYQTDSMKEKVKFDSPKINFCNINYENNSRLVKLFENLEWETPFFSVFLSTTHLRNYIDNSYTQTQCETPVGDIGIQTYFKNKVEEQFLNLSADPLIDSP